MNQTIGVNITPQSFQPTLHFSQGDVGRVFVVNVTDYDIPTGATVTCVATKPSGMGFTVSGTVSGNSVTFTSTAEMTDEWGRFPAEIRIASGNTLLGTANFLMIGEKDPHPASTIDGTQEELIPQLTLLVNRVEAAAESVHDLTVSATTLAAGSDATATYDSTNNSIAFGIPRGADGDVTRSEFNDLKSDLTHAEEIVKTNILSESEYIKLYIKADGSYVGSASWQSYARLANTDKEKIYRYDFYGYSNTVGFYAVAFYNGNIQTGTFLGGLQYEKTTGQHFTVYRDDIPAGTTDIIFCTRTASATDQTLYKYETRLDTLKSEVSNLDNKIETNWGTPIAETVPMVVGGIVGTSGADDPRTDRMRSDYLEVSKYSGTVTMPTGVNCIVHGYDSNMNWISAYPSASWQSSFTWGAFPNTFVYIRFVVNTGSLSENITISRAIYTNQELTDALSEADSASEELDFVYSIGSKNQIARLGWKPYSSSTPPEQSNASYALALKNGCKIMLCDVRVTSDGEYVLWHDATLNNTVKHTDGTALSESELATTIEGSTLEELNVYDYGVYKGSEYTGMKIPMLKDFLEWCGLHNTIPMLEIKVLLTTAQCVEISKLCKMYGLGERVIIDEYTTNVNTTVSTWIANLPKATISIIGGSAIDLVIPKAQNIINEGLNALVVLSSSSQLSAIQDNQGNIDYEKVQSVTNIGADFVYTEIQSANELQSFYEDGYLSVFKYVASSYVDIDKWIGENA